MVIDDNREKEKYTMSTYYIDPYDGSAENDGLSPESALTSPRQISPEPGDRILLRR